MKQLVPRAEEVDSSGHVLARRAGHRVEDDRGLAGPRSDGWSRRARRLQRGRDAAHGEVGRRDDEDVVGRLMVDAHAAVAVGLLDEVVRALHEGLDRHLTGGVPGLSGEKFKHSIPPADVCFMGFMRGLESVQAHVHLNDALARWDQAYAAVEAGLGRDPIKLREKLAALTDAFRQVCQYEQSLRTSLTPEGRRREHDTLLAEVTRRRKLTRELSSRIKTERRPVNPERREQQADEARPGEGAAPKQSAAKGEGELPGPVKSLPSASRDYEDRLADAGFKPTVQPHWPKPNPEPIINRRVKRP